MYLEETCFKGSRFFILMTQNTRIIVNTLATYGRSVVTLVFTLFSARWVLAALGQSDLGLFGVVGSMITFISSLGAFFPASVSRFYAFAIGKGRNMEPVAARQELMKWFNTALSIHILLPLLLVVIGVPVGWYAIDHWLTIPSDRIIACRWVLILSLASSFVSMALTPYIAMFEAHQHIIELVIFNFIKTMLVFFGAIGLLHAPGDHLVVYAVIMSAINAGIPLAQAVRACVKFDACRIRPRLMYDIACIREIFVYIGFKFVGGLGWVIRTQGSAIMINMVFGPKVNSAFSVATQLSGQAASFSANLSGVVAPAVTSYEGEGARDKMTSLALRTCKFTGLLILVFAVPLIVEIDNVLRLWLVNPPEYANFFCAAMLVVFLLDYLTTGHNVAILAQSRIGGWQCWYALSLAMTMAFSGVMIACGCGVWSIGYAYLLSAIMESCGRLYFARILVGMPVGKWFASVLVPMVIVISASGVVAYIVSHSMPESFFRLCLTTAATGISTGLFGWFVVLDSHERWYMVDRLKRLLRHSHALCFR